MRVLLQGGVWHNKVVDIGDLDRLLVPVPPDLRPIEDVGVAHLEVDLYEPTYGRRGYNPISDEVLDIWLYAGRR